MAQIPFPALCAVVTAPTMAELRARRDEAAGEADLVELRLDTVEDPDVAGALQGRRGPVIVTCRAAWEGGYFKGDEATRLRLLEQAWHAGADFVDIEFASWHEASWTGKTSGQRLVVSSHDFSGMPTDLASRYHAMAATGAAVVKLAVTAAALADCVPLLALGPTAPQRQVVLAMGAPGLITRLMPQRFESAWTYAGHQVAPGQMLPRQLRDEFRFGEVGPGAELYGIVANPVGHSVSPAMHNAAHRADNRDAVYLPLQAVDAADVLAFADAFDVRGLSVTLPFKVELLPHCEPDALASRVGAVNTLARSEGSWRGFNTDVPGLLAPLSERVDVKGLRATILGAGGAARGAAIALSGAGARVTVCARRKEAAEAMAAENGVLGVSMPPLPGSWDLLVNATSAGMHPRVDETPWPGALFDGRLVYDLVYNPRDTRLLREAREAGCETLDGLAMLVAQAEQQFAIWTGHRPAPGVMLDAAVSRLRGFAAPHSESVPLPS
jgi:3-dehydroquinate dehydratase/shikimate dehydrogenase